MDYSQENSVFMPGLTARGPVYNGMGALPVLSPMIKYGLMAGLLYLGYKKKLPLGVTGGLVAAAAIWKLFPDAAPVAASGAPTAADIAASTAGSSNIAQPDFSDVTPPVISMPS